MTQKKIKSSDFLGSNYYVYNLTSSNYTPALNGSITITCTVKNVYGDAVSGKSITLYQNGSSVSSATTNSSGVATWSLTCSNGGLQNFTVNDSIVQVFVKDYIVKSEFDVTLMDNGYMKFKLDLEAEENDTSS